MLRVLIRSAKALLMHTHNICLSFPTNTYNVMFLGETEKIIMKLSSNTHPKHVLGINALCLFSGNGPTVKGKD